MKTEFVEMIHPNLPGQVYKAPKQGVGKLARAGWQLAPEKPPAPPSPAPSKPTEAPADAGASSLDDQPPKRRRAEKGE